jgi:hypothetical protein
VPTIIQAFPDWPCFFVLVAQAVEHAVERPVALPPDTASGVASCRNLASLRGYV